MCLYTLHSRVRQIWLHIKTCICCDFVHNIDGVTEYRITKLIKFQCRSMISTLSNASLMNILLFSVLLLSILIIYSILFAFIRLTQVNAWTNERVRTIAYPISAKKNDPGSSRRITHTVDKILNRNKNKSHSFFAIHCIAVVSFVFINLLFVC